MSLFSVLILWHHQGAIGNTGDTTRPNNPVRGQACVQEGALVICRALANQDVTRAGACVAVPLARTLMPSDRFFDGHAFSLRATLPGVLGLLAPSYVDSLGIVVDHSQIA